MSYHPTHEWNGASGRKYAYIVHSLPPEVEPGQSGNYIFAKRTPNGWWPIYIGHGEFSTALAQDADRAAKIADMHSATLHIHADVDPAERDGEVADILAANPEAYEPHGCNPMPSE